MTTSTRMPETHQAPPPVRQEEVVAPPARSWWKNLKLVIPLALTAVGLIAVAAVGIAMTRGNGDNVSTSRAPAAATAPEAAPVTAPAAPVVAAQPASAPISGPKEVSFNPATYKLDTSNCTGDPGRTATCFYSLLFQGKDTDAERLLTMFPRGINAYAQELWGVDLADWKAPAAQAELSKITGLKIVSLRYIPYASYTRKPDPYATPIHIKPGTPLSVGFYVLEGEFVASGETSFNKFTLMLFHGGSGGWSVTVF